MKFNPSIQLKDVEKDGEFCLHCQGLTKEMITSAIEFHVMDDNLLLTITPFVKEWECSLTNNKNSNKKYDIILTGPNPVWEKIPPKDDVNAYEFYQKTKTIQGEFATLEIRHKGNHIFEATYFPLESSQYFL